MKLLAIAGLLLVTSCAVTDERSYASKDSRIVKAEQFVDRVIACEKMGGKMIIPHRQSTRIKRAYTWEEMQTAVCQL